jgi:hypothetical protein
VLVKNAIKHIVPWEGEELKLTQTEHIKAVVMMLQNPAFFPLGVTRLYTDSLSQTLVVMFHESFKTLKFGASSTNRILAFAAPSQRD